jgi:hypothetical protein
VIRQLCEQFVVQLQLVCPGGFVDAGHRVEFGSREVQAGPVEFTIGRAYAEYVFLASSTAFDPVNHPLEHAHVLAVARPDKLAVITFAEPVGGVDLGQLGAGRSQLLPMVSQCWK